MTDIIDKSKFLFLSDSFWLSSKLENQMVNAIGFVLLALTGQSCLNQFGLNGFVAKDVS